MATQKDISNQQKLNDLEKEYQRRQKEGLPYQKKLLEEITQLKKEIAEEDKKSLKFRTELNKADTKSRSLAKDVNKLLKSQKGQLLQKLEVLNKNTIKELQTQKAKEIEILRSNEKLDDDERKRKLNTIKGLNAVRDLQLDVINDFEANSLDRMEGPELLEKVIEKAGLTQQEYDNLSVEGKNAIEKQVNQIAKSMDTLNEEGMSEMFEYVTSIENGFNPLLEKAEMFGDLIQNSTLRTKALQAGIAAIAFSFAKDLIGTAIDFRQELGASVGESLRLSANVNAAEFGLTKLGLRAGEVKNFAIAISQEFGNLSEFSQTTANAFAQLSLFTGITGDSAAKLAKSIQIIQGGTLDSNINTIELFGNLAKAAGVSSKLVLEDIASDTESFAKFAKDGGTNLAVAAISARKLGLSLSTVAGIAENLLDFESSIEKQLEASVLLGRQINLDKARELALSGDLAGLAEEVKNQVGSQADFEAMNVVQRKALADSIGVSVADLGKMIAGEATSAELAEERAKKEEQMLETQMDLARVQTNLQGIMAATAVIQALKNTYSTAALALAKKEKMEEYKGASALIAKAAAKAGLSAAAVPVIGGALALAAIASVGAAGYALLRKAPPALETGGIVTKSGVAEVHKGEAVSGTKNQMGFGADMSKTEGYLSTMVNQLNTMNQKINDLSMQS